MKSRTTLLLVICALAVGGFVVWDHYKLKSTGEIETQRKRLLAIAAADISRIELVRSNETVVAEKTGDQWFLKHPLATRADDVTIGSILNELEFAERTRTLTETDLKGVSTADFGLAVPAIRVTLTGKRGKTGFVVGGLTATKNEIYLQLNGSNDVCVVDRGLLDVLSTGVDNLRSRVVLNFTPATTTRLEIKIADRVIELARTAINAESRWAITKPVQARADQNKVSELLSSLSMVRIGQFISDDPKDVRIYRLDDSAREITVSMGDAGQTLVLGHSPTNDAAQVYAKLKTGNAIFTIPVGVAQKFSAPLNDLRDSRALAVSGNDVRGIELRRGDDKITLVNDAHGWQLTTPIAAAASADVVNRLLARLVGLAVQQFTADIAPDLDKYGLATPVATINLQGQGTNILAQLLIGSADASNTVRYVKLGGEPFIYGVTNDIVNWLPVRALDLRSLRLADMKAEQIRRITIQKAGTQTVIERDAQQRWKLVLPPLGADALNEDVLTQVVGLLAGLRAQKLIREGRENLSQYGLDAPEFVATLQVGDKSYTLSLSQPAGAELPYAFWSDPPLVFSISKASATTLLKSFVTRPANVPASIISTPAPASPTNGPVSSP